jgi:lipid-binding SYLF domain-containing protein
MRHTAFARSILLVVTAAVACIDSAEAQSADDTKLAHAVEVLTALTADEDNGIPTQLIERARGIAVIPDVIRGGLILGGRRGRGVLSVRTPSGEWSNPAFITLTGGSIGWQFGVESADVVLIFANERSVKNIASGKFTLGGDATAVAGPLGRRSTKAVTFKSEVYVYSHSRGLFAGAAFEGARLDIDQDGSAAFYAADAQTRPLEAVTAATPQSVRPFLASLQTAALAAGVPRSAPRINHPPAEQEEAVTFPLE